ASQGEHRGMQGNMASSKTVAEGEVETRVEGNGYSTIPSKDMPLSGDDSDEDSIGDERDVDDLPCKLEIMEEKDGEEDAVEVVNAFGYEQEEQPFKQGAEAKLYRCIYLGKEAVLKERFPKKYRHPAMDEILTKERIKAELRAICKCRQMGVDVPAIYFVNAEKNHFIMERIGGGVAARQYIEDVRNEENFREVLVEFGRRLGAIIGKIHENGIMHGDLTSSNVLLRNGDPKHIVLLDFGLSEGNATTESKGVDLYVLERAINSTHADTEFFFESILQGYKEYNEKQFNAVFKKLEEIRLRGRKRDMVG
uniref:non-specific serine/threonine protein kinase n=2 Tax=Parascaris univalens TaxID=6257 RepID=A0A915BFL7_PARUN